VTHPQVVDFADGRHLICPTRGCAERLRPRTRLQIRRDDELRLIWRCPGCHKVTELAVNLSDSVWLHDGNLMSIIPAE